MAQFRAVIQGSRGEASRLGTKRSHMRATVQSYEGQVNVVMYHVEGDPRRDTGDYVRITLAPHGRAADGGPTMCLYDGPCDGWRANLSMRAVRITNDVTTGVNTHGIDS